ncbi:hypothetical protein FRB95_012080 [Tulasnella sp. JGI-2019a]|nr:hypothetical protein FRB95_012080 [Tulasnella sp. JGI-2019a]
MCFRKRAKDVAPYVVGGTKIGLDVLSKVTSLINPPCVGAVIGVASQIITIVEGVKANRDDTKMLIGRLLGLLVVISESYQGENDEDVDPGVRTSVRRLRQQLDTVLREVEEIRAETDPRTIGGTIRGGLLYLSNGQKIKGYTTSINWAMDTFQVEGRIQDAIHLRAMYTEMAEMHTEVTETHAEVTETHTKVTSMHTKVTDIQRTLGNLTMAPNAQDTILPTSSVLPPQPPILYGRDEEVINIAGRITSTTSPRLAILGPGGIGKTTLLMAVREHPDVEQKFGESRFLVRCEEATTVALLVELIARSLGIETSSSDRMGDVRVRLGSLNRPVLLLLDNFETPWDISGKQTQVEEILCSLASFSHVAILITMRSNAPPSTNVSWSRPPLEPLPVLSKDAARDLYINIDPDAARDSSLDALLAELSYMPLAITLMASLGIAGEAPTALLDAWKDKAVRTDLLHSSSERTKSVNISIRLSIESNLMRCVPEALTLLSVIAALPAGANTTLLPTLVPSIRNLVLAKATLRRATLTNTEPISRRHSMLHTQSSSRNITRIWVTRRSLMMQKLWVRRKPTSRLYCLMPLQLDPMPPSVLP